MTYIDEYSISTRITNLINNQPQRIATLKKIKGKYQRASYLHLYTHLRYRFRKILNIKQKSFLLLLLNTRP
jgi:hypothetical protein